MILYCFLSTFFLISNASGDPRSPATLDEDCRQCKVLVKSFKEQAEKTDAIYLGKDRNSETQLTDIMEQVCKLDSPYLAKSLINKLYLKCMKIAEENDEFIEKWFVNERSKNSDLENALCVDHMEACCPEGQFGPECSLCPGLEKQDAGYVGKVCSGHGTCNGDGNRFGNGKCSCSWGYKGELCTECADNFFPVLQHSTFVECKECYEGCKDGCTGEGPKACKTCKDGYVLDENDGCKDIDECKLSEQATDESSKKCIKEHETCVNKPGSFVCECEKDYIREDYKDDGPCIFDPDKCYEGCKDACTGEGPKACKSCQDGYIMDENEGCKDIDECKISSEATDESSKKCTTEHEVCVNSPGSFNCECDKGYVREEGNDDSLCVPEVKADDQSGKGTKEESEILMSGTVDGKSETEGGAMPISEAILGTAHILTEKDQKEESENVVSDSDDGRSETTETEGGALPINEAILSMGDSSHKDNKDEL